MDTGERMTLDVEGRRVSALLDHAAEPVALAVLAHGAGVPMTHPFMAGAAAGLVAGGVSALRFNFVYAEVGRRAPDRAPLLHAACRAALAEAVRQAGVGPRSLPIVAAGKSLGGRMLSLLAAEDGEAFPARAVVFLGYPLHAPGRFEVPRDAHLERVAVPMLFVQGTNDALARFDLIEALVARLGSRARLHAVEGGDHSFEVRGRPRPDEEVGREAGAVAAAFVREVVGA